MGENGPASWGSESDIRAGCFKHEIKFSVSQNSWIFFASHASLTRVNSVVHGVRGSVRVYDYRKT